MPHAFDRAADRGLDALGQLGLADDVGDPIRYAAQILAVGTHPDIERAANLVMVHFGGGLNRGNAADHIQARRLRQLRSAQRNGAHVGKASDRAFGILHIEEIVVIIPRVDPDVRGNHLV